MLLTPVLCVGCVPVAAAQEEATAIAPDKIGHAELARDLAPDRYGESLNPYAMDAIHWAVTEGIINGDGMNLNPMNSATRAEFACMFARMVGGAYQCKE